MVIPHYIFRLCNLNHKSRPILYVLSAYKVKDSVASSMFIEIKF